MLIGWDSRVFWIALIWRLKFEQNNSHFIIESKCKSKFYLNFEWYVDDFTKSAQSRVCCACALGCSTCSRTYVLLCLHDSVWRARLLMCLRHMSYMFALLKYLTCLRACVPGILTCLVYFTLEKSNSKNSYKEEFGLIPLICLKNTFWTLDVS